MLIEFRVKNFTPYKINIFYFLYLKIKKKHEQHFSIKNKNIYTLKNDAIYGANTTGIKTYALQ